MLNIQKIKQTHDSDTLRLKNTNYFHNYALLTTANLTVGIAMLFLLYRK